MATAAVQTVQPVPIVVPPRPEGQPDIGYTPDYDKYQRRIKSRQQNETLSKTLPTGFPAQLKSDLVWDGNTLAETYDWNYVLTEADKAEVDAALQHFKCEMRLYLFDSKFPCGAVIN